MIKDPKCTSCGGKLRLSKIEIDTWICKDCNEIILDKDLKPRSAIDLFLEK